MLHKDAEPSIEGERRSKLETQVTNSSVDLQQARAQNSTDMDILEGVKTAQALLKRAPQQRIFCYVKEREKFVSHKAVIAAEFLQFMTDMGAKTGRLQAYVDDATRCTNEGEKTYIRLLLSEKSLKPLLRHRLDDHEKFENLP